jgi:Transcriptional regulator, AbiEi antitoxin, Type IV TA system
MFKVPEESHNHAWVMKLDLSKLAYGKGKRMIIKGGRLNTKYNITVPDFGYNRGTSANSA